jgi:hypothetical protein
MAKEYCGGVGKCGANTGGRSCVAFARITSERDGEGAYGLGAGAVALAMQNEHQTMLAPVFIDAMCVYRRFGRLTMHCALILR